MRGRVFGIEFDGSLELTFCTSPVPLEAMLDVTERGMSLTQPIIQFQRLHRRRTCFRHRLLWRTAFDDAERGVRVCEASVGQRVVRVLDDGVLEIADRLLKTFVVSLVPEIAPFDVRLISLRVFGVVFRELLLLRASQ